MSKAAKALGRPPAAADICAELVRRVETTFASGKADH